jgi:hypothetical protein
MGAIEVGILGDGDSDLTVSGESRCLPLLLSLRSELLLPLDMKELGDRSDSRFSDPNLTAWAFPRESGDPLSIPVVVEIDVDEVKSGDDEVGLPAAAIRLATSAAAWADDVVVVAEVVVNNLAGLEVELLVDVVGEEVLCACAYLLR